MNSFFHFAAALLCYAFFKLQTKNENLKKDSVQYSKNGILQSPHVIVTAVLQLSVLRQTIFCKAQYMYRRL